MTEIQFARFDVCLVSLDPTVGTEIQKTRPCVIVSPDEMNVALQTVIVAPMTTKRRDYPTRVSCTFKRKKGQVALDQLRAVDKHRLIKKLGVIDSATQNGILNILQKMFAP